MISRSSRLYWTYTTNVRALCSLALAIYRRNCSMAYQIVCNRILIYYFFFLSKHIVVHSIYIFVPVGSTEHACLLSSKLFTDKIRIIILFAFFNHLAETCMYQSVSRPYGRVNGKSEGSTFFMHL